MHITVRKSLVMLMTAMALPVMATESEAPAPAKPRGKTLQVVHSHVGDSSAGVPGKIKLFNIGKKQQYSAAMKSSYDPDIFSPKSATYSADGKTFYINSLEGCKTVAYDSKTLEKKGVIEYKFTSGEGPLWAEPSGFYPFTHYQGGERRAFSGKPVESTWSHGGKYLWVPFYRRTFDINAQDPSAIAVVDVTKNAIVRMFETGPLPKMVATSNSGELIAVTHWGDNTVGMIDISGNPDEWHHLAPMAAGYKLNLNFPLDKSVDRDANSGYLLRGTVFTPDDRYLLVSGMAGPMSVFDVDKHQYAGQVPALIGVRHLAIKDGYLYGSCNTAGTAIKVSIDSLVSGIERAQQTGKKTISFGGGVKTAKVGGGARTLEVSPDGKYLFVACNSGNAVYVVDTENMKVVDHIRNDSFPVGLALSPDGRQMIVTSQGRPGSGGGNAVNIYRIERPDHPEGFPVDIQAESDTTLIEGTETDPTMAAEYNGTDKEDIILMAVSAAAGLLAFGCIMIFYPRKKKEKDGKKSERELDDFIDVDKD